MAIDTAWLAGRTLSVIGLVKNAGKTTVLNALLGRLYAENRLPCPAVTSIGRDGESQDVVTGTDKPGIFIRSGTLIATAAGLLPFGDFTREILQSTGARTPLGEVYILRALSGGRVQLGGPSMVEQLKTLKKDFFALGADTVLIDGAAGRRSPGTAEVADGVILCSGAALSPSVESAAEQTAFAAELLNLPLLQPGEDSLLLPGAVTDAVVAELLKQGRALQGKTLAAEDASKLLFSRESYNKLLRRGARLTLLRKPRLLAIALNPTSPGGWRFDSAAFCRAVEDRCHIPAVDVMEDGI